MRNVNFSLWKRNSRRVGAALVSIWVALWGSDSRAAAFGSGFTYQGLLTFNGVAASGPYDFQFTLHDAASGGSPLGNPVQVDDVTVDNGVFTAVLDFGVIFFNGQPRWLELHVRPGSSAGPFSTLAPRQELTPTPYALYAATAESYLGPILDSQLSPNVARLNLHQTMSGTLHLAHPTALTTVGAVGIGTASPVRPLTVAGDASGATVQIQIQGVTDPTDGFQIGFNTDTSYGVLQTRVDGQPNGTLALQPNGGKVGIGTTTPDEALHVAGTVKATAFKGEASGLTGISGTSLANGAVASDQLANGAVTAPKLAAGAVVKSVNSLKDDVTLLAGENVTLNTVGNTITLSANGGSGGTGWSLTGNASTDPSVNFIGTIDTKPLELRVNKRTALRLEPTGGTPNVILGSEYNAVLDGVEGATISGGGDEMWRNFVEANFGTIGGGLDNTVSSIGSVVGGGLGNIVETGVHSVVGGGVWNAISAYHSVVGGGFQNRIRAYNSVVGGGARNSIYTGAYNSVVGGGSDNTIGAYGSVVGGGFYNQIGADANYGTVGGGRRNIIADGANSATIGGGIFNTIMLGASSAVIGGGQENVIDRRARYSSISGGVSNAIQNEAEASVIGGGKHNFIIKAEAAGIGGGEQNYIGPDGDFSSIGGGAANTNLSGPATIGGGLGNLIDTASDYSTIAGGASHTIETHASQSTIGGGFDNCIQMGSWLSTIAGGQGNVIQIDAEGSAIGGGGGNQIHTNANSSTIAGGTLNIIGSLSRSSAIGGGAINEVRENCDNGTIGGGLANTIMADAESSTISGGIRNKIGELAERATIGGGGNNLVESTDATVSGGRLNRIDIQAFYSSIAGGFSNSILEAASSTIGGGFVNRIGTGATESSIAGGTFNEIEGASLKATIGGGELNLIHSSSDRSTIGGGAFNEINGVQGAIGGGFFNVIEGGRSNVCATIPGGCENLASSSHTFAAGHRAKAVHRGAFVWGDSSDADIASGGPDQFVARASGGVFFLSSSDGSTGVQLPAGGGAWLSLSDRNVKENFQPVDGREVLRHVVSLPIQTWNMKTQEPSIRHIGPMAQDFHESFNVGEDERHIATVDADGVALAAIQGLHALLKEKETEIRALQKSVAELKEMAGEFAANAAARSR